MATPTDAGVVAGDNESHGWNQSVFDLVRTLPNAERAVVTLSYFRGRSYAEIARELGVSRRAVSRALASALAAIAQAQTSKEVADGDGTGGVTSTGRSG